MVIATIIGVASFERTFGPVPLHKTEKRHLQKGALFLHESLSFAALARRGSRGIPHFHVPVSVS